MPTVHPGNLLATDVPAAMLSFSIGPHSGLLLLPFATPHHCIYSHWRSRSMSELLSQAKVGTDDITKWKQKSLNEIVYAPLWCAATTWQLGHKSHWVLLNWTHDVERVCKFDIHKIDIAQTNCPNNCITFTIMWGLFSLTPILSKVL